MADGDIKVSIITVVYNGAKTIEQTIQSVLGQSYKNIEYIIIDGLSTDGTQQIIEKYERQLAYYVSEKDDGLYDAMNKGLKAATGTIIGIINSDDWYAENAVEEVVRYFQNSKAQLVYGKIRKVSKDLRERDFKETPLEHLWYEMAVPHPSVFVKKEIYDRLGTFHTGYRLAADYELLLRFYSQNVTFGYLDRVLAYFRLDGLSRKYQRAVSEETYEISLAYADKSPCRADTLQKIVEKHNWSYFAAEICSGTDTLLRLIREYFHENVGEMIIFGTGAWGDRCYECLNNSKVKILYFTDNDPSKWNTKFRDVKILKPDELENTRAYVLIAVKENSEEIRKQLAEMKNKELSFVSIRELEERYVQGKE